MSTDRSPQLSRVEALVRARAGLTAAHVRPEERMRVIRAAMQEAGAHSEDDFARLLETSQARLLDLASRMSVGETYFFRDADQLLWLADQVLPQLLSARPRDAVLRVWSAGCASGEEPYTLAMLFEERGLLDRADIVGTDISREALRRAAAGVYGAWSLRALPGFWRQRYFSAQRSEYVLAPWLKERVRFERQSLIDLDAPYPGGGLPFDLVVCRNVLIYFTQEAQLTASQRLAASLAQGGLVIAGASDPFATLPDRWRRQVDAAGVSFTRVDSVMPPVHVSPKAPDVRHVPPSRPPSLFPSVAAAARAPSPAPVASEESLLLRVRDARKRSGNSGALEACRAALSALPHSVALHLLWVSILVELDRDEDAFAALRALLYLERSSIMGQLLSALLFRRSHDYVRAARAYRRAAALCDAQPADGPVPEGEGVTHAALQEICTREASALEKLAQAS